MTDLKAYGSVQKGPEQSSDEANQFMEQLKRKTLTSINLERRISHPRLI